MIGLTTYHTATHNGKCFHHFGIHKSTAALYGDKPEDILNVSLTVADDQSRVPDPQDDPNINEPDYWGWWDNDRKRFTMVYPKYFLLNMCFPNGIKASEEAEQGTAYRLIVKKR